MITIRPTTLDDAAAFLALRQQVDHETKFMMLEPGERQMTVEQERERLANMLARPITSRPFSPRDDGQLVGWLWANGGDYRRNHHNVHIVIGIRAALHRSKASARGCFKRAKTGRASAACTGWNSR